MNFICKTDNHILTIIFNRPESLNAFTETMVNELIAILDQADLDDDIKAIIVTGNGRAFCAGADLGEGSNTFASHDISEDEFRDWGGRLSLRIFDMNKPMIAAINGAAVGVGATMILPMDIRIASSTSKFGFVFTRRGIAPEACSGWFLPRVVGISKALEWTMTGKMITADEALISGLVNEVASPLDLMPTAKAIAKDIIENASSVSVALTRQLMWKMLGASHPLESHKIESKIIRYLSNERDAKEGVASFLEKRPPQFSMTVSEDLPSFYPWWEKE